jgi:hypothetical protein
MELSVALSREELVAAVQELTPMRVELSRRPRRVISFGRPSTIDLVAGAGLRIRGDARIEWELAGLAIPATLRAFQVLLVPSIVAREGAYVLAFDPVLEELDFRRIPGFFDERLVQAINEGLAAQRQKLAWNFSRTLSVDRALPAKIAPPARFRLAPASAEVCVTSEALRLRIAFQSGVTRGDAAATTSQPVTTLAPRERVPA